MDLGRKVLNLRKDRQIEQQVLARLSGITPSALSKIEHGINHPGAMVLYRIARQLGVTMDYLLDPKEPYPARANEKTPIERPKEKVKKVITREEWALIEELQKMRAESRRLALEVPYLSAEMTFVVRELLLKVDLEGLKRFARWMEERGAG